MQGLADGYFVLPYTIGDYLARDQARRRSTPSHPEVASRGGRGRRAHRSGCSAIKGKRTVDVVPPRARQASCGRTAAWRATTTGLETALAKIPALREEFWQRRQRARQRRGAQPVAREGRPRGRLPRARRADVPRRAASARSRAAATSARSTRRPTARRCATTSSFCHVAAWEYAGRRPDARAAQGAARVRERPPRQTELQVSDEPHPARLAAEGRRATPGRFVDATRRRASARDMSFLEMLDVRQRGADRARARSPIAFDHDCREGICGTCGVDDQRRGRTGRSARTTACQLHMRSFKDGDDDRASSRGARAPSRSSRTWCVDRSAFDRIIAAGGFVSVPTGSAPDGNAIPVPEGRTPSARWTRPPASAAAPAWRPARTRRRCSSPAPRSRTSALLPQGQPERDAARARDGGADGRARASAAAPTTASARRSAPRGSSSTCIARMNRDFLKATPAGSRGEAGRRRRGLDRPCRPQVSLSLSRRNAALWAASPSLQCGRSASARSVIHVTPASGYSRSRP